MSNLDSLGDILKESIEFFCDGKTEVMKEKITFTLEGLDAVMYRIILNSFKEYKNASDIIPLVFRSGMSIFLAEVNREFGSKLKGNGKDASA